MTRYMIKGTEKSSVRKLLIIGYFADLAQFEEGTAKYYVHVGLMFLVAE